VRIWLEGGDETVGAESEDPGRDPQQTPVLAPALPGTADLGERGQHEQQQGPDHGHDQNRTVGSV
jgi:hypothetical protein